MTGRDRRDRRLRMALIGGGPGSFIGPIHRIAAELDREIELVAGAFSQDHDRAKAAGATYRIDPARAYPDVATLVTAERERSDGADFVTIATPNHHHLEAARHTLSAGMAVMCDKPVSATLAEAEELATLVEHSKQLFFVSYTYSGYPMVREARARVAAGELGTVRKVLVEYVQGWLADEGDSKQAAWRLDPARGGTGGCISDIGVHAFHLAEFVTGLRVTRLLSDLGTVVPGRRIDDDCQLLLRFENGARGALMASQIAFGEANGLSIRVYGDNGSLAWMQASPETLTLHRGDGAMQLLRRGEPGLSEWAQAASRMPTGHPEGYLEALANLYRDFATVLRGGDAPLLPDMAEGLRGMTFMDHAVEASRNERGWIDLIV